MFGSTANQPSQGGGLFGAQQPVQQQQQQQQGGLFGTTQQQPQQQGNSLFGSTQQPATGQTSSLFGGTQQQQPSGTSLFGGTQQQQTGSSLFGSAQPPLFNTASTVTQPQQQSNLGTTFGAKPLTPQPTLANLLVESGETCLRRVSASLVVIVQSHALPTVAREFCQGVVSRQVLIICSLSKLFTKSTKFNDLPENIKKVLEDIE